MIRALTILLLALSLISCSDSPQPESTQLQIPAETIVRSLDVLASETSQHNLMLQQQIQQLQQAVNRFTSLPTETTLSEARQQWIETHLHYVTASTLLLASDTPETQALVFRLDAWPILPGFLDNLPAYPDSGIINDTTVKILPSVIREQHGITDSAEVSLGLHALEYFLWGRTLDDFQGKSDVVSRRRALMDIQAAQLLEDSNTLIEQQQAVLLNLRASSHDEIMLMLLQVLDSQLTMSFEEVNLAPDAEHAHAYQSGQVWQTVTHRLKGIMNLLDAPVNLGGLLEPLDAEESVLVLENVTALLQDLERQISEQQDLNSHEVPLRLSMLTHSTEHFLILANTAQVTE